MQLRKRRQDTKHAVYMLVNTNTNEHYVPVPYTANQWINIVWQHGNNTLSAYKNGQFVSSVNDTFDFRSNYNIRIGSNYQPDNQAKQKIAVLKQYRRSLTAQEIAASYNAYSSRFV